MAENDSPKKPGGCFSRIIATLMAGMSAAIPRACSESHYTPHEAPTFHTSGYGSYHPYESPYRVPETSNADAFTNSLHGENPDPAATEENSSKSSATGASGFRTCRQSSVPFTVDNSTLRSWALACGLTRGHGQTFADDSLVVDAFPQDDRQFQSVYGRQPGFSERIEISAARDQTARLQSLVEVKKAVHVDEVFAAIRKSDKKNIIVIGHNKGGRFRVGSKELDLDMIVRASARSGKRPIILSCSASHYVSSDIAAAKRDITYATATKIVESMARDPYLNSPILYSIAENDQQILSRLKERISRVEIDERIEATIHTGCKLSFGCSFFLIAIQAVDQKTFNSKIGTYSELALAGIDTLCLAGRGTNRATAIHVDPFSYRGNALGIANRRR